LQDLGASQTDTDADTCRHRCRHACRHRQGVRRSQQRGRGSRLHDVQVGRRAKERAATVLPRRGKQGAGKKETDPAMGWRWGLASARSSRGLGRSRCGLASRSQSLLPSLSLSRSLRAWRLSRPSNDSRPRLPERFMRTCVSAARASRQSRPQRSCQSRTLPAPAPSRTSPSHRTSGLSASDRSDRDEPAASLPPLPPPAAPSMSAWLLEEDGG
jgi:hypothetical protein